MITRGHDGEMTTRRRSATEAMAVVGTGGGGNGIPATPDHAGGTAEGRRDLSNGEDGLAAGKGARGDSRRSESPAGSKKSGGCSPVCDGGGVPAGFGRRGVVAEDLLVLAEPREATAWIGDDAVGVGKRSWWLRLVVAAAFRRRFGEGKWWPGFVTS